ncbi:MAG: NUDIX domain-containing protein [Thermomicrobiales bacterium]
MAADDITVTVRFNYRIAGVCIERGHILLGQLDGTVFWLMPGGLGKLMETATDTFARETEEELGVTARIGRLLWIVENVPCMDGRLWHERG